MNTLRAAALIALAVSAPARAQQRAPATPAARLSAQSSYEPLPRSESCTNGYRATGVRYSVVGSQYSEGHPPYLVLEEKTTIEQCENLEGPTRAEVSVVARPARQPGARPAWIIRRHGEAGAVFDELPGEPMYRVTEYGCCGSEDLDAYYSLVDGHALFTADHPLLYVEARPFGTGMVAVHDADAAGPIPGAAENDRTLVAAIAFGGTAGAAQRLVLRGPSGEVRIVGVELVARGPGGRQKQAQTLGVNDELDTRWTVAAVLELERMRDGTAAGRVEIPIENGRLAVEKARAPAPFRVAAAAPR